MLRSLALSNPVTYPSPYPGAWRVTSFPLSPVWWRLRSGNVPAFLVSSLSAIGTAAPTRARHETMLERPQPRPSWKSTVLVLERISIRTRSLEAAFLSLVLLDWSCSIDFWLQIRLILCENIWRAFLTHYSSRFWFEQLLLSIFFSVARSKYKTKSALTEH